MVHYGTVDMETSESSNATCNSCLCNTKGRTISSNPADLKHLIYKQSTGAVFTAECFFQVTSKMLQVSLGRRDDGNNRLIRTIQLKIKPLSLCRCSLKTGCGVSCEYHQKLFFFGGGTKNIGSLATFLFNLCGFLTTLLFCDFSESVQVIGQFC